MTAKLTRAEVTAMRESVLREETKRGRRLMASRFIRDVLTAIAQGRCTDHRFCARLAIRTWAEANR